VGAVEDFDPHRFDAASGGFQHANPHVLVAQFFANDRDPAREDLFVAAANAAATDDLPARLARRLALIRQHLGHPAPKLAEPLFLVLVE
jgi:hypothetical protein